MVGSEKNAGKTVTLNRLRAEAFLAGYTGFGLLSVGWDGESHDRLHGTVKPAVTVYPHDVIVTGSDLLEKSTATFKVMWAAGYRSAIGRQTIARVMRQGEVELSSVGSVEETSRFIKRLKEANVRKVLVDGALDRKTPISASEACDVGLVFSGNRYESLNAFVERIKESVHLFRLPLAKTDPVVSNLKGHEIAFGSDDEVTVCEVQSPAFVNAHDARWLAVGGPMTDALLDACNAHKLETLIANDPSRLFLSRRMWKRLQRNNVQVKVLKRPMVAFVSVRSDHGNGRVFSPRTLIDAIEKALPGLPIFDPLVSETDCPTNHSPLWNGP